MRAIVQSYFVPADASFAPYTDGERAGALRIERMGGPHEDKWGIFASMFGNDRLHRAALTWRAQNPTAPLVHADDRLAALSPERAAIVELFHASPSPSSRTDAWKAAHTFTLAEAFALCGVEAPPAEPTPTSKGNPGQRPRLKRRGLRLSSAGSRGGPQAPSRFPRHRPTR